MNFPGEIIILLANLPRPQYSEVRRSRVSLIKISGDPSWTFFFTKSCGTSYNARYNMLNRGVLDPWRWELYAEKRKIFKKPCTCREIDIFNCFGAVFYEGSMEMVWLENANILSAISISGRLWTRRGNFLKKCKRLITDYVLFGQLASRNVRWI